MVSAAGLRGKPGIVIISPQTTTMKPAPALRRTYVKDANVKTTTAQNLAKFPPYLVPMKSGTV